VLFGTRHASRAGAPSAPALGPGKVINAIAIVLMIYFLVAASRISSAIGREAAIFEEFKQSRILKVLVWFFPVGPLLMLVGTLLTPFLVGFVLCLACYLPGMLAARKCMAAFERAGTDRVKGAQDAVTQVFGNAIGGLAFTFAVLVIVLSAEMYAPRN